MDAEQKRAKLAKLLEIEGYDTIEALFAEVLSDAVSPAICTQVGCDYTTEMEPDQDAGYCEVCGTQTVVAAPVLADLI